MAATTNEDTVLQLLTPLFLRDLGQTLEGDIFQALKQSPHVVRSLEFALADGAIDCSRARPTNMSYAERLMHIFSFEPDEEIMSEIVLFDVKSSSTDDEESHRVYKTVEGQRRRVGFWVCISAADPHWVDVIPNRHQDAEALAEFDPEEDLQGDRNDETINAWRDSRLHSAAHRFLDPCATPYRMPLVLLPLAIDLIRRCALGLGDFTNPWSGVTFRNWRPITTRRTEWLKPMESTAHYTSFEDAWEVFKGFRSCASMKFDLVGLQPSLADYKLCRTVDRRVLQTFVQAKGEGRIRGQQNKLDKVCAVRKGRYYFDVRDRLVLERYNPCQLLRVLT